MARIIKIVLTGGPCAGKTTAKEWVKAAFTKTGLNVLFIDETATELFQSGITPDFCNGSCEFEHTLLKLQQQKERIYEEIAENSGKDTLIVCDRGMLDCKAYVSPEEYEYMLSSLGTTEEKEKNKYDAVFHLTTTAGGEGSPYTLANNTARNETPEEAKEKDKRTFHAWEGHPYHRVIENTPTFNTDEKMAMLLTEIKTFLQKTGWKES